MNQDENCLVILNGTDFLRIIAVSKEGTISHIYESMRSIYNEILQFVKDFDYDSTYGYINSDVLNCGCGFELRLFFDDTNNFKEDFTNDFDKEVSKDLQCQIFNKIKYNVNPSSVLTRFIDFLKTLKGE